MGVSVGTGVGVAVGTGVGVAVGAGVEVSVGTGVGVFVGIGVEVAVGVDVEVAVGVGVKFAICVNSTLFRWSKCAVTVSAIRLSRTLVASTPAATVDSTFGVGSGMFSEHAATRASSAMIVHTANTEIYGLWKLNRLFLVLLIQVKKFKKFNSLICYVFSYLGTNF